MTTPTNGPDKIAPHSAEAEEAILGSVLINPDSMLEVAGFLESKDFFILRNGWIWNAICAVHERGEAIDNLTAIEELRNRNQLDAIGGSAYITSLINNTPTHIHAETYARIVERAATRRRLLGAAGEIAHIALEEDSEIGDVIDHAEQTLFTATTRKDDITAVSIYDVGSEYWDRTEALKNGDLTVDCVTTGLTGLDKLLNGGMRPGELALVAARLKVGKTSLLLNTVYKAAAAGKKVELICMEMTAEQLYGRLVSARAGIPYPMLNNKAGFTPDMWERFQKTNAELMTLPIFFKTAQVLNLPQIERLTRRLAHQVGGLDLIVVDFLQMMPSSGKGNAGNRPQELMQMAYGFKALAMEQQAVVMLACQLNRDSETRTDHEPKLSDIGGSDGPAQAADIVMFPYREDAVTGASTGMGNKIFLAAQRNGPTSVIPVKFYGQYMLWADDNTTKTVYLNDDQPKTLPLSDAIPF